MTTPDGVARYATRTLNPRDQGMSLADCLNALPRQGWRIVGVLAHDPAGETRLIVERTGDGYGRATE